MWVPSSRRTSTRSSERGDRRPSSEVGGTRRPRSSAGCFRRLPGLRHLGDGNARRRWTHNYVDGLEQAGNFRKSLAGDLLPELLPEPTDESEAEEGEAE